MKSKLLLLMYNSVCNSVQTMWTIKGSNKKINALAHTRNFFVYQIENPHASDLSVLQVVVPARRLLSGLKQMVKKGMRRVLLQYSASLVPELWLFLIHSQVFNPSIVLSYQPAAVQLVVVCYDSLPGDYYICKDCNWT